MSARWEPDQHQLHRLAEARKSERVTRRCMARRLNISLSDLLEQEDPATDLPVSVLSRWAHALGVPIADLLVDPTDRLSPVVQERCRLVRIMKTVRSLQQHAEDRSVRVLAERLVDELVALMPELKTIASWNEVGTRRRLDEHGQAVFRGRLLGNVLHSYDSPHADETFG